MRVVLATLCLNEMEWLPKLFEQHRHWPGLVEWVFVESADIRYAKCNPDLVTDSGLSVDGTTEYLEKLAKDGLIHHIRAGFCAHADPAQGKCAARECYLNRARELNPDWVIVIDADEFYIRKDQERIVGSLEGKTSYWAVCLRQRHLWNPNGVFGNPFVYEVVGGYWKVPHCRIWKWHPGLHYTNDHNTPCLGRMKLSSIMLRADRIIGTPECLHLGYASCVSFRAAKHRYYIDRGEGREMGRLGRMRQMYVDCRAAFESWEPGDTLPHGAEVIPYQGPVPEAFCEKS